MKKIKTSLKNAGGVFVSAFLFASAVVFAGCAFSEQNVSSADISDISAKMSFENVSRQAYMGGSVLYNPDDLSNSQLAENVCVAVRLGKVKRNEIDEDQVVFTDDEDSAKFGFMKINSISTSSVAFSYTEFSADGKSLTTASFNVAEGDSVDINSDGFYDLKYAKPKIKRVGLENARWLTFLSSQDDLNTSMFSVLPEQYSRNVYPAGLLGINPDGKFIVNKYEVGSSKRAAVVGVCAGDFVLDSKTGNYQKIIGRTTYRSARTVDESDLKSMEDISDINFYFDISDFLNGYSPFELIAAIPDSIISDYGAIENIPRAVEVLNSLLDDRNLSEKLSAYSDVDDFYTNDSLTQILALNSEEIVRFNRILLGELYPDFCPKVDYSCADISNIFPLLSVNLSKESEPVSDSNENSRSIISTAKTYGEYEKKKKEIDDLYKEFHLIPICKNKFDFDENVKNGVKFFLEQPKKDDRYSDSPMDTVLSYNDMKEISGYLQINNPAVVENGLTLQFGIMGHFKISFGNIEGGLYAGIYVKAETELSSSKVLLSYSENAIPAVSLFKGEEKLIDVNLNFCNFPPITVGVVTFQVSVNGGIQIPTKIELSGNIITTMFIGYTGFYAIGLDIGANYGIKYKTLKIFRKKIKIPCGFHFSPYAKGSRICESAFFAGPISDLKKASPIKITSAKFECEISPYIYVEPRLKICNALFGGMRIGPSFDIGAGIKLEVDEKDFTPKYIDVYGILGGGVKLAATYGIDITIPIIKYDISRTGTVNIDSPLEKRRTEYSLCKIKL